MSSTVSSNISVVVFNDHCHPQGGGSRVAIDEAIALANRGIQVTFVGAVGPVCAELAVAPLKVICLEQTELAAAAGQPSVMLQGLWNVAAFRAVSVLLRKFDPRRTIVHLHGFTQALSASPVRCALNSGFKVVYTMHEFFAACPNGGFFDYVSRTPCRRRALSLSCVTTNCDKRHYAHKLYRVARSTVQRQFGGLPRDVHDYIALSKGSEKLLRPYLPRDARIYFVENPVEVLKTTPVDVARNDRIIAVGRLEPEKGIDVLLEAARQCGMQLTLVGEGSLRHRAEASAMCRVTGWISRQAVLSEMESARCLVFPSVCYETYGLAVAEAAARGVPAIVSDITAAAERVGDEVTGWHARAGDAGDLARCLNIIRDDAVVRSAGKEAYARFWSNPPTPDRHISDLMAVYTDILERSEYP